MYLVSPSPFVFFPCSLNVYVAFQFNCQQLQHTHMHSPQAGPQTLSALTFIASMISASDGISSSKLIPDSSRSKRFSRPRRCRGPDLPTSLGSAVAATRFPANVSTSSPSTLTGIDIVCDRHFYLFHSHLCKVSQAKWKAVCQHNQNAITCLGSAVGEEEREHALPLNATASTSQLSSVTRGRIRSHRLFLAA